MPPNFDISVPSSPDPLGNSSLAETPFLSPTKSAMRRTPPDKTITPSKNSTNNIKLQDFILKTPPAGILRRGQSPTKSTAKTENLLSPWRIRVTVEAERDEDKQGAGGRTSGRVGKSLAKSGSGRTTTTLVPLKGLDDSSPPPASMRSARSTKLDRGSSPIKGGGVAALVRKRGLRSGEDDAGRDLSVGATPGKRGRGRPRKSLPVEVDEDVVMTEAGRVKPTATPLAKKARGKRKAMSPVNIAVDEDLDGDVFKGRGKRLVRNASVGLVETSPNRSLSASPQKVVSAPRSNPTAVFESTPPCDSLKYSSEQGANNAAKEMRRSATPRHPGHQLLNTGNDDSIGDDQAMHADPTNDHLEFDSILESEGFSMVSLESIESARQNLSSITKTKFLTNPALHPPRLGPEVPETVSLTAVNAAQKGATANNPQEADLGGGKSLVHDSDLQHSALGRGDRSTSSPHQSKYGTGKSVSFSTHHHVLGPDSSEASARQVSVSTRSSTEKQAVQQKTPLGVQPTPRLPPPIQPRAPLNPSDPTSKPKPDTPKLCRVVRAGIALQGVLDSNARETNARGSSLKSPYVSPANKRLSNSVTGKSPKERLDDLFEGFGAGTRRELRAGLRLGEELARRHKLAAQAQQVGGSSGAVASEDDVFTESNETGYPKLPTPEDKDDYALAVPASAPQQVIEYPSLQPEQLLSPERSEREEDEMDWQVDTPVKTQNSNLSDFSSEQHISNETVGSISKEKERREAQWQREREVVSREIDMANSSQVIVISGDDTEAVDESLTLEEDDNDAADVDICQAEANSSNHPRASPSVDGDLFPEDIAKPRRGKIPSPWRRDSQMVYSDEATEDMSGLFWQPDQRAIQLAKEREERRRRKESHLDVSGMLKIADRVNEESRVIINDSTDGNTHKVLQTEVEITIKEEQTLHVETVFEGSCHREEAMATEQGGSSSEVESDREDSDSEDAMAPVSGAQSPELASSPGDLYDSEEVAIADGGPSPDTESNAETTYYSEAEAEAEAEAEEIPQATADDESPTNDSKPAKITTDRYVEAYLRLIRNAHPKPTAPPPPQPTTWLGKLTSIASFLQDTLEPPDSWTNAEYRLLDGLYQRAKVDATICPYNPNGGYWGFRLCLGHTLYYGKNYSVKIAKPHLGIVDAFREIVRLASLRNGGDGSVEWSEYYVVQRLFSVMVAEDMRARGIPFPDREGKSDRVGVE